jgi:DNA-binding transcriptional ArsR family regulator
MTNPSTPKHPALQIAEGEERVFHEPSRLAIMSVLLPEKSGLAFVAIKEACSLTDGNLSRHLKTLEDVGAVKMTKEFKNKKPLTTVKLSAQGRKAFMRYLKQLEQVLVQADAQMKASAAGTSLRARPATS